MKLEGDPAAPFRRLGLVIIEHAHEHLIHAHLDMRGSGGDAVGVPVARPDDARQALWLREHIRPAPAIRSDGYPRTSLHEKCSAMLIVDAAQPHSTLIEVGLIAACMALRAHLAAILDA